MVESEAALSEEVMGAVTFGHREMQKVINAINELTVEAGTAVDLGSSRPRTTR